VHTEKERKTKEVIDEHAQKVEGCLSCFNGCLDAFLQGDRARCESTHKNCDFAEPEADIGIMESEIDKKKHAIMRTIYRSGLTLIRKIHLERFVRQITEISDVIEDASDRLDILVIRERI